MWLRIKLIEAPLYHVVCVIKFIELGHVICLSSSCDCWYVICYQGMTHNIHTHTYTHSHTHTHTHTHTLTHNTSNSEQKMPRPSLLHRLRFHHSVLELYQFQNYVLSGTIRNMLSNVVRVPNKQKHNQTNRFEPI